MAEKCFPFFSSVKRVLIGTIEMGTNKYVCTSTSKNSCRVKKAAAVSGMRAPAIMNTQFFQVEIIESLRGPIVRTNDHHFIWMRSFCTPKRRRECCCFLGDPAFFRGHFYEPACLTTIMSHLLGKHAFPFSRTY